MLIEHSVSVTSVSQEVCFPATGINRKVIEHINTVISGEIKTMNACCWHAYIFSLVTNY